jgi:hypothetical protein
MHKGVSASSSLSLPLVGATPPRKKSAVVGEGDRKRLAEVDFRRAVGGAIERAILLSGLTKQEVAGRMGYEDQSALSRWISGVENPHFAKLFSIPELRAPLVLTLAGLATPDIEIETTLRLRRTA